LYSLASPRGARPQTVRVPPRLPLKKISNATIASANRTG
jgi:hypothetical protein